MRLMVLDQIQVTAVRSDLLQAGEEIEVSDALGSDLTKSHPHYFVQVDEATGAEVPAAAKRRKKPASPDA